MTKFVRQIVTKAGHPADRLTALAWLGSIRSRLYLAFGLVAGLTVIGSLFAIVASRNISATLSEIASRSMPATVESFRLSDETSRLIGSAPRLMSVGEESDRAEIASEIGVHLRNLEARIARLRALDASESGEIAVAQTAMADRLSALNEAVADRIRISDQRRALAIAVRKAHEKLLETITPAIDDANFDLMTKGQTTENRTELNRSIDALRRLLEVQADANLLAGVLIEASMVTDSASLPPMRDVLAAAERSIDANLKALPNSEQRNAIATLYGKLAALGGEFGIIVQRTNELKREREAQDVYASALSEATKLRSAVENLIRHQGVAARTLSGQAISQINVGRIILIVLSITALVAAGLIGWLYVGRSIVGRLTELSETMRRIAAGDTDVAVTVGGHDEIAGMAQALLVFRRAIEDVSAARQSEGDRARQSDVRRQQMEKATQDFEHAVNDIVQALDSASSTMDQCAQIMAETARHNRKRATATASASEEATTNVSNVAMAADEIAQSVEQISDQARSSANIARQASDEAKTIIGTVEQLAAAVGQINSVSNLIRNVAAQTNLLALNATI